MTELTRFKTFLFGVRLFFLDPIRDKLGFHGGGVFFETGQQRSVEEMGRQARYRYSNHGGEFMNASYEPVKIPSGIGERKSH